MTREMDISELDILNIRIRNIFRYYVDAKSYRLKVLIIYLLKCCLLPFDIVQADFMGDYFMDGIKSTCYIMLWYELMIT